jgi:hypothetical protein
MNGLGAGGEGSPPAAWFGGVFGCRSWICVTGIGSVHNSACALNRLPSSRPLAGALPEAPATRIAR